MSGLGFSNWVGLAFREAGIKMHQFGGRLQGKLFYEAPLSRHRRVMAYNNNIPNIGQGAWIAPNATVIGRVDIGERSSIWYGAVVRGDVENISIGSRSNIQDRAVIHVTSGDPKAKRDSIPTIIGDNVTVESGAIIHACTLKNGCKVEFGAKVLDGATVGENSVIAAGSVVPPGKRIPPGQLWAGTPAVFIRNLSESEITRLSETAEHVHQLAQQHDEEHSKPFSLLYKEMIDEVYYKDVGGKQPRNFTPPPIE